VAKQVYPRYDLLARHQIPSSWLLAIQAVWLLPHEKKVNCKYPNSEVNEK